MEKEPKHYLKIFCCKTRVLNTDGLVILESSSKDKFVYSEYYTIYKERKYGDKFILILNKTK